MNGSELALEGALPPAPALLPAALVTVLLVLPPAPPAPPVPAALLPLTAAGVMTAGMLLAAAGTALLGSVDGLTALAAGAALGLVGGADMGTIGLALPATIIVSAGFPAAPPLAAGAPLLQAALSMRQSKANTCCCELRRDSIDISHSWSCLRGSEARLLLRARA